MTNDHATESGYIGNGPSSIHFCKFHTNPRELVDTLVPYFAAGLRQNEFCVWVTSDPSGVEGARIGLREVAPHFDRYFDMGQIEIWDYRDWYLRGGHFDADRVLGQWVEKEKQSQDSGYKRLRVTGDTAWLRKEDWADFMAYEAEVNRVLPQHSIIGLCTYPVDGCTAEAALEVIRNHQMVLGLTAGEREMTECVSFKAAHEDLSRMNDNSHGQMEQAGHLDAAEVMPNERLGSETSVSEQGQRLSALVLEQRDKERRWIAGQLHEVTAQNLASIAFHFARLQHRKSLPSEAKSILEECDSLCRQSLEQVLTLSHLLHPPILDLLGLAACLRLYIRDFMKLSRIPVEFETRSEVGRLRPEVEIHLFRIVQEALSSIDSHSGSLNAIVRLERRSDQVILWVEDFSRGVPAAGTAAMQGAADLGLGILEIKERLRKIGGQLEIRSSNRGTMLTVSVRL